MGDIKRFHFSCVECGKCCVFPPDFTLRLGMQEAFRFADRVPLFGGFLVPRPVDPHIIFLTAQKELGDAATQQQLQRRAHEIKSLAENNFYIASVGGRQFALAVTIESVPEIDGRCMMLDPDQRCSAYQDRPLACRIWPLTIGGQPHEVIAEAWSKTAGPQRGQNECLTGADAPLLAEIGLDGDLIVHDPAVADARTQSMSFMAERKTLTAELLRREPFRSWNWIEAARQGVTPHFGFDVIVDIGIRRGVISVERGHDILLHQLDLIVARIDRAVQNRDPSQRERTRQLRHFADRIKKTLATSFG